MSKKRIIIIVVAVIVVIGVIGAIAGGGSENDESSAQDSSQTVAQESSAAEENSTAEEEASAAESSEEEAASISLAIGDVIETGEWRLTIDDIQITPSVPMGDLGVTTDAEKGKTYVVVCFTLENLMDHEDVFNIFYLDAYEDGIQTEFSYLIGDVGDYSMIGTALQAGRAARSYLAYEVSENFQQLEISYSPMSGEDIEMLIVNE